MHESILTPSDSEVILAVNTPEMPDTSVALSGAHFAPEVKFFSRYRGKFHSDHKITQDLADNEDPAVDLITHWTSDLDKYRLQWISNQPAGEVEGQMIEQGVTPYHVEDTIGKTNSASVAGGGLNSPPIVPSPSTDGAASA